MVALAEILANGSFWVAVLRIATPLILGTLGVLWCERAGVLNLGIEGIMVAGAFTGWLVVYLGAPLAVGVLVAAATGRRARPAACAASPSAWRSPSTSPGSASRCSPRPPATTATASPSPRSTRRRRSCRSHRWSGCRCRSSRSRRR
jgi:hypothetical protein